MDQIHSLGSLALGSRLKRLSERFMVEAATIYAERNVPFEPRWFPLFSLVERHGPLAMGDAARMLGVTHAAVSQNARDMVRRKLVKTTKDVADERRTLLSLTSAGQKLSAELKPLWNDIRGAVDEAIAATGADVISTLSRLERSLDEESIVARTTKRQREREFHEVKILDFKPSLAKYFRDLNVEWIEKYFRLEKTDREFFADPKGQVLEGGGHILFAELAGDIVGTCALLKRKTDEFELAKMAVTPRAQGKHIGKKLMLAAIERARKSKAKRIYLETNDSLTPAVNLYRSVGFMPVSLPQVSKYARVNLVMGLTL